MQFIFKIIILSLIFCSLTAFGDKKSFVSINEKARTVEIAFRTYFNSKTDQLVKLIPVFHIGDQKFYDQVRDNMSGATALYESVGLTLEDIEDANRRIRELGGSIATIFSSPELTSLLLAPNWTYTYALALGLVHQQEALRYDTAKKLIHADKFANVHREENKPSDELLRKALNEKIGFWSLTFPSICKKTAEYYTYCYSVANWLSGAKESFLRTLVKEILEPKSFAQDFHERNQIVLDKLAKLINKPDNYPYIVIIYGANHAPFFAEFLNKNGFDLIKTDWVVLTSLDQS